MPYVLLCALHCSRLNSPSDLWHDPRQGAQDLRAGTRGRRIKFTMASGWDYDRPSHNRRRNRPIDDHTSLTEILEEASSRRPCVVVNLATPGMTGWLSVVVPVRIYQSAKRNVKVDLI